MYTAFRSVFFADLGAKNVQNVMDFRVFSSNFAKKSRNSIDFWCFVTHLAPKSVLNIGNGYFLLFITIFEVRNTFI